MAIVEPLEPIAFSRPFIGDEEARAVAEVIASGWIVGGSRLARFEAEFAESCGAAHAVGVSSWTTGAFLVLRSWGIGPGDEVIVPSLTFIASVNVIAHAGATPVFADIEPDTFNVSAAQIAKRITPRTKAIIAVDQLGLPCDMESISRLAADHNLLLLEDAACAFGSRRYGRPIGADPWISVFSLHARKVLTTAEGGMIVTSDESVAKRLRMLRHQGMSLSDFERHDGRPTQFESYPEIGYNFRFTDLQAAMGLAQLSRLSEMLARRKAVADRYNRALAAHPAYVAPHVPAWAEPNWQSYQIGVVQGGAGARNDVMELLNDLGVPTRRGVMASHREPPYAAMRCTLPHTEQAADYCLQLPIHPGLTAAQQDRVIDALESTAVRLTRQGRAAPQTSCAT
jgi:perosamine synthetase